MSRHDGSREPSVARQVLVWQVAIVLVLVAAASALAAYDARRGVRVAATDRAVAVAESVADSPTVLSALGRREPSSVLQPFAERVRRDTAVDFVVVMRPDRTRYTHPDPDRIGEDFIGDLGGAPQGRVFTQQHTGTLGPSVRAVVPVFDGRGRGRSDVVALVSVGITLDRIDAELRRDLALIGAAGLVVLAAGCGLAWLVSRRLRRLTHGLGEREITRMYEYYSAVLHAVREGLLLVDDGGAVQLANDEARRLLDLPEDVTGVPLHDLGLPPGLVAAMLGQAAEADDIYLVGEHVLVVSSAPASWQGRRVGSVASLRDHTELRAVTGELDVVRRMTESLRAQTHESANRLHTMVSLVEMGRPEEAVAFATDELEVAQHLTDRMLSSAADPVLAALLLGKSAEAAERGVELRVVGELPVVDGLPARDLVTVVGNLVDNALDAVEGGPDGGADGGADGGPDGGRRRRVEVRLLAEARTLHVVVGDSGPGLTDEAARRALERGWTTKAGDQPGGRGVGLALVEQVARRHGGSVGIGTSPLGGAELAVDLRLPVEAPDELEGELR